MAFKTLSFFAHFGDKNPFSGDMLVSVVNKSLVEDFRLLAWARRQYSGGACGGNRKISAKFWCISLGPSESVYSPKMSVDGTPD